MSQAGRPWEKGRQSLATSRRPPTRPLPSVGLPCSPARPLSPAWHKWLGGIPQPKPLHGHALVPLLRFWGGQPSWPPGVGGRGRRREKQSRGRGRSGLTAQAPLSSLPLAASPASTSFSAEWVPPPRLPSLRAGGGAAWSRSSLEPRLGGWLSL